MRPPLVGAEPLPTWRTVWPYRVGVLLLTALLVLLAVLGYRALSGATAQDPGVGALGTATALSAPAPAARPGPEPAAAR